MDPLVEQPEPVYPPLWRPRSGVDSDGLSCGVQGWTRFSTVQCRTAVCVVLHAVKGVRCAVKAAHCAAGSAACWSHLLARRDQTALAFRWCFTLPPLSSVPKGVLPQEQLVGREDERRRTQNTLFPVPLPCSETELPMLLTVLCVALPVEICNGHSADSCGLEPPLCSRYCPTDIPPRNS
eukprot:3025951-Rhodomonas_salina.2